MEFAGKVFIQVLIIIILMAVGFVLSKAKVVDEKGTGQMTNVLLQIVMPCVLIDAYQKEFSIQLLKGLLWAVILSVLIHLAGLLISYIFLRSGDERKINIFSAVYSNCGFMAIPLISAALGPAGVFYGSAYLAVFTILVWTQGICMYDGSIRELSIKRIITNPGIIGTVIALLLFVFEIKLPYVIGESVKYIAGLNTPLAMIVTGAYLTRVDIKKALKNISIYGVSVLRLIIIPIIGIFMSKLLAVDEAVSKAVLISAACPTAAIAALLATRYKLNSIYASELVAITTLMSVVTIPLILMII